MTDNGRPIPINAGGTSSAPGTATGWAWIATAGTSPLTRGSPPEGPDRRDDRQLPGRHLLPGHRHCRSRTSASSPIGSTSSESLALYQSYFTPPGPPLGQVGGAGEPGRPPHDGSRRVEERAGLGRERAGRLHRRWERAVQDGRAEGRGWATAPSTARPTTSASGRTTRSTTSERLDVRRLGLPDGGEDDLQRDRHARHTGSAAIQCSATGRRRVTRSRPRTASARPRGTGAGQAWPTRPISPSTHGRTPRPPTTATTLRLYRNGVSVATVATAKTPAPPRPSGSSGSAGTGRGAGPDASRTSASTTSSDPRSDQGHLRPGLCDRNVPGCLSAS